MDVQPGEAAAPVPMPTSALAKNEEEAAEAVSPTPPEEAAQSPPPEEAATLSPALAQAEAPVPAAVPEPEPEAAPLSTGILNCCHRAKELKICGVLMEPILGEGAIEPIDLTFLQALRRLCDESGALLIADEVQTHWATGYISVFEDPYFANSAKPIKPDVIVTEKANTGDVTPLSVILARQSIAEIMEPGSDGSKYDTNPVAIEAASATLDMIEEEGLGNLLREKSNKVRAILKKIQEDYPDIVKKITGFGSILGVEFCDKTSTDKIVKSMMNTTHKNIDGLYAKVTKDTILRLSVNTAMKNDDLGYLDKALRIAIKKLSPKNPPPFPTSNFHLSIKETHTSNKQSSNERPQSPTSIAKGFLER